MVIYLHLFSHQQTQEIYVEQTENIIIDLKKDFLKDTVNNIFFEIDKFDEELNPEIWTAFLWDNETKIALYGTSDLQFETTEDSVEDLKSTLGPYTVIKKGNIDGIFTK